MTMKETTPSTKRIVLENHLVLELSQQDVVVGSRAIDGVLRDIAPRHLKVDLEERGFTLENTTIDMLGT